MKRFLAVAITAALGFALAGCPAVTPKPVYLRLKAPPPPIQEWNGEVREAASPTRVWVLSPSPSAEGRYLLSLFDLSAQTVVVAYELPASEFARAVERTRTGNTFLGIETVIIGGINPPPKGPRPRPGKPPWEQLFNTVFNAQRTLLDPANRPPEHINGKQKTH